MSKIVRAYVEEMPKPSLSLLRSINGGSELGEGVWDNLKTLATGGKKPGAAAPVNAPADEHNRTVSDSESDHLSTTLTKIVSKLLNTADDRYVMFTTISYIEAYYLKSGGGSQAIVQVKDDDDIKKIAAFEVTENSQFELKKLPPKFQFSDLISSDDASFDAVIILDIPKSLSNVLEKEKSSGDAKKIREVLMKMMSFKYYVMTLALGRAKAVAAQMAKAKSLEEKVAVFNPRIIANYPIKNTLDVAKNEWRDEYGGGEKTATNADADNDEEDADEGDGENSKLIAKVVKTPSGGLDLQKSLITAIMAGEKNADEIALAIFNSLNKLFTFDQVSQELTMIGHKFDSNFVLDKLHKELAAKKDIWTLKQPAGDKSKPKAEPAKEPAAAE